MSRLPSLIAIKAFEAVGRTQSIRAAGEELAVSPTVVSRHLQNLQSDLGVDLVAARGRGIALTPKGEVFHARVTQAFDLLRQAVNEARPLPRESLAVWCIPGIANRRLLLRLPELQKRLKSQEIILKATLSRPDFNRAEADAEIVYLDRIQPTAGLQTELLAEPRVFPVASPAFVARYPHLSYPSDLLTLPLIHEKSPQQWVQWFNTMSTLMVPPLRGPRLWHAHLAVEAARLGQGVALANTILVEEDLAADRLVEVIPSGVRLGGYYLIAPTHHRRDPAVVALRNWLKSILREPTTVDASDAAFNTNS
jgi:DNA-binding transcriptional LysR family regulator